MYAHLSVLNKRLYCVFFGYWLLSRLCYSFSLYLDACSAVLGCISVQLGAEPTFSSSHCVLLQLANETLPNPSTHTGPVRHLYCCVTGPAVVLAIKCHFHSHEGFNCVLVVLNMIDNIRMQLFDSSQDCSGLFYLVCSDKLIDINDKWIIWSLPPQPVIPGSPEGCL